MKDKSIYGYYCNFSKRILSPKFLKKLDLNRSFIKNSIERNDFVEVFSEAFYLKDFSSKKVCKLFKKIFEEYAQEDYPNFSAEQWLNYIYQYILSISFKEAVSIELSASLDKYCCFLIKMLKIFNEYELELDNSSFIGKYPLRLLEENDIASLEYPEEYRRFATAFEEESIYELMKLSKEITGYNTLDHICGVHYLAVKLAKALKSKGLDIDLGRVSGSAAGHDIGKYGCKGQELKRVPYLHYYYSDQWFLRHDIHYIRNIAVNHSTWDLELENLPIESLVLIYSDFRVKNKENTSIPTMWIYSLEESFQIILNKLDNVDEAKEKRYKKVYNKLLDFQGYIESLGIDPGLQEENAPPSFKNALKEYSLLQGKEITNSIKNIAIEHNISLMYSLRDEYSLEEIIEAARSEKAWKKLREYIRIFEEYSNYLTQAQKIQALKFLCENITHPEDDIRKHCAEIIGSLISSFDEDYRKEIPSNVKLNTPSITSSDLLEEYINRLLYPSHKVIAKHRYWMGYNLSTLCKSIFASSNKNSQVYRRIFISYFDHKKIKNADMHLFLMECVKYLPLSPIDSSMEDLLDFIINSLNTNVIYIRLSTLETLIYLTESLQDYGNLTEKIKAYIEHYPHKIEYVAESFLLSNLKTLLSISNSPLSIDTKLLTSIYLNNLKSATHWVVKRNNIGLILNYTLQERDSRALQSAIHFSNILKVSEVESVRNEAGQAIVRIMPKLTNFEKNDVAVELIRSLEIEGHKFTEYIPIYLGQVLLFLEENELDEVIEDLHLKIKTSNPDVKTLILKTVAITIQHFLSGIELDHITDNQNNRLIKLIGILLNGLGDYDEQINISALSYFSKGIFQSQYIDLKKKHYIYSLTAKKLLTLIYPDNDSKLLLLSNSAALNQIYRFISDYSFQYGNIEIKMPSSIAFFPGTFDPFSLSHKEIAVNIRDLGYEVYLAVDEFSWSKRTLPNIIRRNIIKMSIASELNIYMYPENLSVNIANAEDLKVLRDNFKDSEVYIATGSDVILNASSYSLPQKENSIHSFSHLVIDRGKSKNLSSKLSSITGKIIFLNLPKIYKDISSTQIRNYIDENKDISSLIDPEAQKYIYENGFYQREPIDKNLFSSTGLEVEVIKNPSLDNIKGILKNMSLSHETLRHIPQGFNKNSSRILLLKEVASKKVVGMAVYHWIKTEDLYRELGDLSIAASIREKSYGRVISLDALITRPSDRVKYYEGLLLSEALANCIANDYQYAICSINKDKHPAHLGELLKSYGFVATEGANSSEVVYKVNIGTPCVINYDVDNFIKEPFKSNSSLRQAILKTRSRLQQALCKLYPGELVLPIYSSMLHYGLINKICKQNGVPTATEYSAEGKALLGKNMCVPYGDILDGYVIPNTVTKALHTEKYFHPDMSGFNIDAYPYFLSLENQVKMIKSFNRPVILVDTILHKGYRMKVLNPLFKEENIKIDKIIVGILSARGKDLMEYQNRQVDTVYFIPRLRLWFNESSLYPFIGGDALWRGELPKRNLLPSINLLLPYTSPDFIRGASKEAIFNLSKTAIENSIEILSSLETLYHKLKERNLSLLSLGQVMTIPRYPDHGRDIAYDLNLTPTHYLRNDLELLNRLNNIIRS